MIAEVSSSELRLSACRALLGQVSNGLRLAKVKVEGQTIAFTAIAASDCDPETKELMSEVTTSIIADFPDCDLSEQFLISDGPLPKEDIFKEGWLFERYEPSSRHEVM